VLASGQRSCFQILRYCKFQRLRIAWRGWSLPIFHMAGFKPWERSRLSLRRTLKRSLREDMSLLKSAACARLVHTLAWSIGRPFGGGGETHWIVHCSRAQFSMSAVHFLQWARALSSDTHSHQAASIKGFDSANFHLQSGLET